MNITEAYKILGLPPGDTIDNVKKSYRKLAKRHHPDVNPGGQKDFEQIQAAYDIINNKKQFENQHGNAPVGDNPYPTGNPAKDFVNAFFGATGTGAYGGFFQQFVHPRPQRRQVNVDIPVNVAAIIDGKIQQNQFVLTVDGKEILVNLNLFRKP